MFPLDSNLNNNEQYEEKNDCIQDAWMEGNGKMARVWTQHTGKLGSTLLKTREILQSLSKKCIKYIILK